MPPFGAPTSCLRLMWSSTEFRVAVASSTRQTVSASASLWIANQNFCDSWSDHMTPMLVPNATSADRSSDLMVVSGTLGLIPVTHGPAPPGAECASQTVDCRVYVTQYRPSESWSMLADSDPPVGRLTGKPA